MARMSSAPIAPCQAFSTGDTSMWGHGEAPCGEVLQGAEKNGRVKRRLCPVWTVCGRNKAPRELVDADVWVGHVLSMDTPMPAQVIDERLRYFEYIAQAFDVVVFDEADDVQARLDAYGAAMLSISGSEDSIHRQIQEQIHDRSPRREPSPVRPKYRAVQPGDWRSSAITTRPSSPPSRTSPSASASTLLTVC